MEANKLITEYRNKRNLSQLDVAAKAGMNIKHYQAVERGDVQPRLKSLLKIANAIDIPFDLMFKDSGKDFLIYSVAAELDRYDKEELKIFYNILGAYINE